MRRRPEGGVSPSVTLTKSNAHGQPSNRRRFPSNRQRSPANRWRLPAKLEPTPGQTMTSPDPHVAPTPDTPVPLFLTLGVPVTSEPLRRVCQCSPLCVWGGGGGGAVSRVVTHSGSPHRSVGESRPGPCMRVHVSTDPPPPPDISTRHRRGGGGADLRAPSPLPHSFVSWSFLLSRNRRRLGGD